MTHLRPTDYRSIVSTLEELGLVISDKFRESNDTGGSIPY